MSLYSIVILLTVSLIRYDMVMGGIAIDSGSVFTSILSMSV